MSDFYDWKKTRSYDAEVTMVIGPRGIGKTFGLRKDFIKQFIDKGYRYVDICRYKTNLTDFTRGYFDKLSQQEEFADYYFKSDNKNGYIGVKTTDERGKSTIEWHMMCYFIPLSNAQQYKTTSFANVRNILLDECVIEKSDIFHHYLPNEYGLLAGLVDTVSRERPGVDSIKPRVYLLGNACDISNPYMAAYGVGTDLKFGYRWYAGKTFLFHYVRDDEYSKRKLTETVAGHMYNIIGDTVATQNIFDIGNSDFIEKKTPKSVFKFGIVCNGEKFGIWADYDEGLYFVSNKIPKGNNVTILALTLRDNRVNYIAAKRAGTMLRDFVELHYLGVLRYENADLKIKFEKVLALLGIK